MNDASFGFKKIGDVFVLSFPFNPAVLWFVWMLLVIAFITVSWILVHHWGYYGVKENRKVFAKTIYFIGGIAGLLLLSLVITGFNFVQLSL